VSSIEIQTEDRRETRITLGTEREEMVYIVAWCTPNRLGVLGLLYYARFVTLSCEPDCIRGT